MMRPHSRVRLLRQFVKGSAGLEQPTRLHVRRFAAVSMEPISDQPLLLKELASKTAVITGGSNGIGAQTARLFNSHGANVVIADLECTRKSAESLIASLPTPKNALFIPTNTLDWYQMTTLFRETISRFGSVQIAVANAGIMESQGVFDLEDLDENGDLKESTGAFSVIDVNIKGTLNTLRLALHHMQANTPCFADNARGSVVLVSSTSGYFGGTGVGAYVASKHGVTGILRSSQLTAVKVGVRVNAVAPFFTPTHITAGFSEKWTEAGLKANTPNDVANAIAQTSIRPGKSGTCCLIAGKMMREMEDTRTSLIPHWLGDDVSGLMSSAGKLFASIGGYPLPKAR